MKHPHAANTYVDTINDISRTTYFDRSPEILDKILKILFGTIIHFFGDFNVLFSNLTDGRALEKVKYSMPALAFVSVLMFLCHLGARRQIRFQLRTLSSIGAFRYLFEADDLPHGDTINDAFKISDPEDFQQVICRMNNLLIRKKVLYDYRVLEKYFVIAVDGTGTLTYSNRHCAHCLTQTQNGKTIYYHEVLEAKLVTSNGLAFSMISEFIENPGEKPNKQDCELKAFYRLAPRLKAAFPRLPVLLTLDALFACGPVFKICSQNNWKFMIVLKDRDLPSVIEEFHALSALQHKNRLSWHDGNKKDIKQDFRWVDQIPYTESAKNEHTLHVIECVETKPDKHKTHVRKQWKWVTNLKLSPSNVIPLANQAGRTRWKIENQGFNAQKTGGFCLEHGYTTDPNAAKIFYYLLQIAHTIAQLMYLGSLLGKTGRKALGAVKNLALRLLEAWRYATKIKALIEEIKSRRFQIKFRPDTS